jgi:hypothetical protein
MDKIQIVGEEQIERSIHLIRGQKVLLDVDLAELYGVPTKRLNEQVRRNLQRFPPDFMFQLEEQEVSVIRSQFVTESEEIEAMRSQIATASRRNIRYLPYAFTEHAIRQLATPAEAKRKEIGFKVDNG